MSSLGQVISMTPMLIKEHNGKREIDVLALIGWVNRQNCKPSNTRVVIEKPSGSKSSNAAKSMEGSFHALRALFELGGYEVTRVHAKTWQKALLNAKKGDDTKKLAIDYAKATWPEETFLATARSRVPHDGMVDACCIAQWARTTQK